MMKKNILILALMAGMILTVGCGDDTEKQQMENQISQLEQQVADLQGGNAGDNASPGAVGSPGSVSTPEDGYGLEAVKAEVAAAIKQAEDAAADGTTDQKMETYFKLKSTLDQQDHNLDLIEDNMERDYRAKKISYEEYRSYELTLDGLGDQLDQAEDRLELRFGIDD